MEPHNEPQTRICRGPCGRELPIESFRKHSASGTAREYDCRDCHNKAAREWDANRRSKVLRQFVKVGQFQKLDCRLRSLGASVISKLGGVDKAAKLWAAETKKAVQQKRTDRFVGNSFTTLFRLVEFSLESQQKERASQAARAEWTVMADAEVKRRLREGMMNLIKAEPEIAIAVAAELGWTLIPPGQQKSA
jgi:hypothetical protein